MTADTITAIKKALDAKPVTGRNDEAGYVEFLNEDVPYTVRDIDGRCAILVDLHTRKYIGYRVYDPGSDFGSHGVNAEPTKTAPAVAVKADREAIARIIDPHSFFPDNSGDDLTGEMVKQGKELAFIKADRVIASLSPIASPDEPKRVKLDTSGMKFGSCQQCDVRDNLGIAEDGSMICGSCSDANHLSEWIDYARSLRALSAQVQEVAEGWQLVPKEPTEEMHNAARDWAVKKYGLGIGFDGSDGCYRAMLAAAPALIPSEPHDAEGRE